MSRMSAASPVLCGTPHPRTSMRSGRVPAGGVLPTHRLARATRVVPASSRSGAKARPGFLSGTCRISHTVGSTQRGDNSGTNSPVSSRTDTNTNNLHGLLAWLGLPAALLGAFPLPAAAAGGGMMGTGFDVTGPESVIQALAILAGIVAVHEAGHFAAARLQGIHVTKFSIGFGPTLLKYQGETVEYSLRAFPLGGFVAFPDDDPESDYDDDDPNLLRNRPLLDRAIVISAGVIANFIFAYAILFTQVSTIGVPRPELLPGVKVPEIVRGSVAARGGFEAGDIIEVLDGAPIPSARGEVDKIVRQIKKSDGKAMTFGILRGEQHVDLTVVPELGEDGYGRIGVQLVNNARILRDKPDGLAACAKKAGKEWAALTGTVTGGLTQIFSNFDKEASQVSGPIAIVKVGADVARSDASGLFQFAALVNINLGVVNLLPLPALDGGYLALLAVEAARGEKLKKEVEGAIMGSGLLLLMGSGLVLILRDAVNLFK